VDFGYLVTAKRENFGYLDFMGWTLKFDFRSNQRISMNSGKIVDANKIISILLA